MNLVSGFDILTMVSFTVAILIALRAPRVSISKASRNFSLFFLVIYIFVGFSNFLDHSGITGVIDQYEDYAEILFAPFFLFFLYSQLVEKEISRRRNVEERLMRMSITDELTGLHNRRGFFTFAQNALDLAKRNGQPLALIFADLDGLKKINDTLGHNVGDEAIRSVAEVLRGTFRSSDIIARLGGDEFVVLITESVDGGSASVAVDRLRAHINAYNQVFSDKGYELSLSIGAVECLKGLRCDVDSLLKRADDLMYHEKHNHTTPTRN